MPRWLLLVAFALAILQGAPPASAQDEPLVADPYPDPDTGNLVCASDRLWVNGGALLTDDSTLRSGCYSRRLLDLAAASIGVSLTTSPAPATTYYQSSANGYTAPTGGSSYVSTYGAGSTGGGYIPSGSTACCSASSSDVAVRGYTRSDGTYVRPHMRSAPDGSTANNFSTRGNTNPYTGARGTRSPTRR